MEHLVRITKMSTQILPTVPEKTTADWISGVLGQEIKSIQQTNAVLDATASKIFLAVTYEDDAPTDRPAYI